MTAESRAILTIGALALLPMTASSVLAYSGISDWVAFFVVGCILSALTAAIAMLHAAAELL